MSKFPGGPTSYGEAVTTTRELNPQTQRGLGSTGLIGLTVDGDKVEAIRGNIFGESEITTKDGQLRAFRASEEFGVGRETHRLLEEYMRQRKIFVTYKGWRHIEGDLDIDELDRDPNTLYVIRSTPSENDKSGMQATPPINDMHDFRAGLRMTPFKSLEESFSFSMLSGNPQMQDEALNSEAWKTYAQSIYRGGNLWDITRCLPHIETAVYNPAATVEATNNIIGGAIAASGATENDVWLFLVQKEFKNYLDKQGIDYIISTSGIVTPGDNEESYFLLTSPIASLNRPDLPERTREQVRWAMDGLSV